MGGGEVYECKVERNEHLLPSGFLFTTTISPALLCNDSHARYVRISQAMCR